MNGEVQEFQYPVVVEGQIVPAKAELHAPNPMGLLQIAAERGASPEALAKFMDLYERWQANEAKQAFVKALNAFKASPPKIEKNKTVSYPNSKDETKPGTSYKHATLDHVCHVIGESLTKHGISFRWRSSQDGALIKVACILTHELGHSEETALAAGLDQTGGKNNIQALGSTVTYLQRYTLLAATGLAPANADDDGRATEPWEPLSEWLRVIKGAPMVSELEREFKAAFKEATAAKRTDAMLEIIKAKDERLKEFNSETPA